MPTNRQIRLARRPTGLPTDDVWERTDSAVPELVEGDVHVRVGYLSVDPAMRGWLNDVRSYVPPVGIGDVMRAIGVGRVVASRHPGFAVGDHVQGMTGVQEHAVLHGDGLTPVDPEAAPLPTHLGVLGISGFTAYFGLFDIGRPEPGQTVVVSGAAGSVGSVAGQLAKIHGCRVVGIAGGAEKCAWVVDELGFDACIDYRSADLRAELRRLCPDRVDVYFDNVGGPTLDAVLGRLARGARVVICGAVSQYNAEDGTRGPANYLSLLVSRARMEGFVVFDYADRYGEAATVLAGRLREGRLRAREDVVTGGVDAFPDALLSLFRGGNTGKLVLEVSPPT